MTNKRNAGRTNVLEKLETVIFFALVLILARGCACVRGDTAKSQIANNWKLQERGLND